MKEGFTMVFADSIPVRALPFLASSSPVKIATCLLQRSLDVLVTSFCLFFGIKLQTLFRI